MVSTYSYKINIYIYVFIYMTTTEAHLVNLIFHQFVDKYIKDKIRMISIYDGKTVRLIPHKS